MSTDRPITTDCRLFDCVQVNLAILADRWHGVHTHLNLGSVLRFWPTPGPAGLPTVERSLADQLAEAAPLLGLDITEQARTRAGEPPEPAQGRYIVSDAYHLPWVPYAGQRHMEHSFLLEADAHGAVVVDGYHNETPWGSARPLTRRLDRAELAAAVPGSATTVTFAPARPAPATPATVIDLADDATIDAYVSAYTGHPDRVAAFDRLTLETWLLARSRRLHASFLDGPAGLAADPVRDAHVAAWEALAESVYVGYRRVARGRSAPAGTPDRLAAQLRRDREVFGAGTAHAVARAETAAVTVPAPLRDRVADTVAAVLTVDVAGVLDADSLADLPGFTSFRVVEIIERLEHDLSVECAADDLVPENLHHLDGIGRIVLSALHTAPEPARIAARTGGN
ncbi:acyl carrier protein [Streptomyces sp. NPDC050264]|uniref:acyl carrier protein n=1 Tax=Streptomyces sp. NPDC050264 TaxID=3155038 RepID=UPI00344A4DAC